QRRAAGGGYMQMSAVDLLGMVLDIAGVAVATLGLLPRGWRDRYARRNDLNPEVLLSAGTTGDNASLQAMDSAKLTGTHWRMISRLFIGAALDTMKPATLAFMLPGLRTEYGLTTAQVSLYPLF